MSIHVREIDYNGRKEYMLYYPGMTKGQAQNIADRINGGYLLDEEHLKQLTAENEELKARLEQNDVDYVALEEAYLQCQKDLFDESEQLNALRAKLDGGVRITVNLTLADLKNPTTVTPNATLILDDGVEI